MMQYGNIRNCKSLRKVSAILVSVAVMSITPSTADSQTLHWFRFTGWQDHTIAYGVSDTGIVVGCSYAMSNSCGGGYAQSIKWEPGPPVRVIDSSYSSAAYDITSDGNTIIGVRKSPYENIRVYSKQGDAPITDLFAIGFVPSSCLGHPPDAGNRLLPLSCAIADDGKVASYKQPSLTSNTAYAYVHLPTGPGPTLSPPTRAFGISPNGRWVVGAGSTNPNAINYRPFRWDLQTGQVDWIQVLDAGDWMFPGSGPRVGAVAVSDDGVVVGITYDSQRQKYVGFIWRSDDDYTLLPDNAFPFSISRDGSMVVGVVYENNRPPYAFVWTPQRGFRDLNQLYSDLLRPGDRLLGATRVSRNGRYIVGWGTRSDGRQYGFRLDIPPHRCAADINADGNVDDSDLLEVLSQFGSRCP